MDPYIGFGLILSLVQIFQASYYRRQDKQEAAKKEDFYNWLKEHGFQEVKDGITNNYKLEVEISNILRTNHDELNARFDSVNEQLARILHGVEGFRELAQIIAPAACLTKNQENLLQAFVNSGDSYFEFCVTNLRTICRSENQEIDTSKIDPKFLIQSAKILERHGFLMKDEEGYMLTEVGQDYIHSLDKAVDSKVN